MEKKVTKTAEAQGAETEIDNVSRETRELSNMYIIKQFKLNVNRMVAKKMLTEEELEVINKAFVRNVLESC